MIIIYFIIGVKYRHHFTSKGENVSFLNEVKNLYNIVHKGIRDYSLSLRMTLPELLYEIINYVLRKGCF